MFAGSEVRNVETKTPPKNASTLKWLVAPRMRIGSLAALELICAT
jgi:hypothetical protein